MGRAKRERNGRAREREDRGMKEGREREEKNEREKRRRQ